jgi:hypothetical protein
VDVSRDFLHERWLRAARRQAKALGLDAAETGEALTIVSCLYDHPGLRPSMGKQADWRAPDGAELAVTRLVSRFANARRQPLPDLPEAPRTSPDPVVERALGKVLGLDELAMRKLADAHWMAMVIEARNGELLEAYLDQAALARLGWVRCHGSVVRSVDFVRVSCEGGRRRWQLLQVKNQDNSENSSSKRVRSRTRILKWHRREAVSGKELWELFPDSEAAKLLVEAGGARGYGRFVDQWASGVACIQRAA